MRDGVELAATLYLPPSGVPQPCLLEALPYRKDDLTSSYAESYVRLCDEFGYAVCRVDVRGTGSSGGDATDEYPVEEQADLVEVIAWLAAQEWCDGGIGMFGTSYSGFNSLQLACERPPALKAVCAIYSSDDRWTDDVHWRGGALRLVDLVDYCHYMTPMNVLPPAPHVWGDGWREEWLRRLSVNEPWVLTWLREDRDGPYWQQGSARYSWDQVECAVMLVAGWADGYRNNTFRTVSALRSLGVPHRLLAGPWVHADPTTAYPGPRLDLDVEMTRFFDQHLRGVPGHEDRVDLFVRTSTRPAPFLDQHEGYWVTESALSPALQTLALEGPRSLEVRPDVGIAAWIDCAGHLPWGLSDDQRHDDDLSLTWDFPFTGAFIGQPRVRLQVVASAPRASLSVKLNDVFPDGTSALITRGTLDLGTLTPGEPIEVDLLLDACAYSLDAGQTLRVSIAGADWPNTVAPPAPVTLTVASGTLELPLYDGSSRTPSFTPGADASSEEPESVSWTTTHDRLTGSTTCAVRHGSSYEIPRGTATESYAGEVDVNRHTFAQRAEAECSFAISWPEVDVSVTSTMRVDVLVESLDVAIETIAFESGAEVSRRTWAESVPRRSAR